MTDPRLVDYISSALSRGIPLNQIKKDLLSKGWSPHDVDYAADLASRENFSTKSQNISNTKEESSKLWIIPVVIVVFLIITGVFMYFILSDKEKSQETNLPETKQDTTQSTRSSIIDCGTDMDCLIGASEKCEFAKLTNNVTINLFGMLITTTSFYEIKGTEANKCVLYLRTENQNIDFSEELIQQMLDGGATPEEIEQQKQESNKQSELVEGLDGTCKFNSNSDLTSLLGKWKDGNFSGGVSCSLGSEGNECTSTGDWSVADCEGKMFGSTS